MNSTLLKIVQFWANRFPKKQPFPFIVGVGRSGTTLLRLMLDSHSRLSIPAETGFIPELLDQKTDLSKQEFIDIISGSPNWPDIALSKGKVEEALKKIKPFTIPEGIRAVYKVYALQHGKAFFGDKTPGYCLYIDQIQKILPEARFIHIIRDGRDVALSVRPLWFSPSKEIAGIAADWSDRIQKTRALSKQCNHYLEVMYESLVADPENEIRKILNFIDLPYEKQVLDYYKNTGERLNEVKDRYKEDGSLLISKIDRLYNHRNTFSPPLVEKLYRWKKEMSKEEQLDFERIAHRTLKETGYKTMFY